MTRRTLLKTLGLIPLSYGVGVKSVQAQIDYDHAEAERKWLAYAMVNGTKHFHAKEMACRCCNVIKFDPTLLAELELLRKLLGNRPITITSGYRCPVHNKRVGGVKNSQHLLGTAADIQVKGVHPNAVFYAAKRLRFTGLGKYNTFTHVDVRQGQRVIW